MVHNGVWHLVASVHSNFLLQRSCRCDLGCAPRLVENKVEEINKWSLLVSARICVLFLFIIQDYGLHGLVYWAELLKGVIKTLFGVYC